MSSETEIRPFRLDMPGEAIADLRRRIAATRWPTRELVADRSQGVQLATIQELARYWATEYDWRACEGKLNALPLIITHGWPGSVIELLDVVGPLTDPTAHGGSAEDAFDLVLPSLPGYGFSGDPAEDGWDPGRIARAWAELMRRLGYARYVAQGGDQGAAVTDAMGRQAPAGLLGIHLNFKSRSRPIIADTALSTAPARKRSATAWPTHPYGAITRDDWLDNSSLYWLTNTATSAARLYWQQAVTGKNFYAAANVSLPAAVTVFPEEYVTAPRSWIERAYHKLIYFNGN